MFSGGALLLASGAAVAAMRKVPLAIFRWTKERFSVTMEVFHDDAAYQWMQTFVSQHPRVIARARTMTLKTKGSKEIEPDKAKKIPEYLLTPAPGLHLIRFKGRRVLFSLLRREIEKENFFGFRESMSITAFGTNKSIFNDLIEAAWRSHQGHERKVDVYVQGRWGDSWLVLDSRIARPIESIVSDIMPALVSDAKAFMARKQWYIEMGIPWRRGYLLEGPPGNGKSSMVMALAGECGMDIYIASLSNADDSKLVSAFSQIKANSIILLEDIDAAFVGREAKGETKLTFSGLLNVIDGIVAKEGCILVMTTNHREVLDPALIRPGRVDKEFHVGNATVAQIVNMFVRFFPEVTEAEKAIITIAAKNRVISMAQLQGHLQSSTVTEAIANLGNVGTGTVMHMAS